MKNRNDVSDAYKAEETAKATTFTGLTFVTSGSFELPTAGTTYPDVAIEWAIVEGTCAVKSGNTVTVTAGETTATATLKATFKVNNESTTKEFTITAVPNNAAAIVAAAYALPTGQQFATNATLTGVITSVDEAFNTEHNNITVTMMVENKAIKCYRMGGNGADKLAKGYTITVSGIIKNFNGTKEFDTGCYLESYVEGEPVQDPTTSDAKKLDLNVASNRTEYSATKQVWSANGITLTNNKGSSTNDVGNYTTPIRIYKNSEVVIECTGMTKIKFVMDTYKSEYVEWLEGVLTGSDYTVSTEDLEITVTFKAATNSLTFVASEGQIRIDEIYVWTN